MATKSTMQPPEDIATKSTMQPSEDMATKSTMQPSEDMATKSTMQPPEDMTTKSTMQPPEDMATKSTMQPPEDKATKSTMQPPEDVVIKSTMQPSEDVVTKSTMQPPEVVVTKSTMQPPEDMVTKSTMQPPEEMATTSTMQPPEEMATKSTIQPSEDMATQPAKQTAEIATKSMQTVEEMVEYLKESNQIDKFVEHYNKVIDPDGYKLRLEKFSPHIYVIAVTMPTLEIKGEKLLMVTVGYAQASVERKANNRMKRLVKYTNHELRRKYQLSLVDNRLKVSTLFKFPIHSLDVRPLSAVEKSVRETVCYPLPREIAKKWGLPVYTEWALTLQEYIQAIKKKVIDLRGKREVVSRKIFISDNEGIMTCNLLGTLDMTAEGLQEELKELSFPLKKDKSLTSKQDTTNKTVKSQEKSETAAKSSTPETNAIQSAGKTSKGAPRTAVKGKGKKPTTTDNLPCTPTMNVEEGSRKQHKKLPVSTPVKSKAPGEKSPPEASAIQTPRKINKSTSRATDNSPVAQTLKVKEGPRKQQQELFIPAPEQPETAGKSSTDEASASWTPGGTSTSTPVKAETGTDKKPSTTDNSPG